MRYIYTSFLFLAFQLAVFAQNAVTSRIVLIGNAGLAVKERSNFLNAVKNSVTLDSNTIVLYLGNNIFEPGDTAALRAEAAVVRNTEAKAIFIPGYRDWADGGRKGYKAIMQQDKFLKSLGDKNIKFYPGDGCPGTKDVNLGNDATLLIMDSQWWLHEHQKPNEESDCGRRSIDELLVDIEDAIEDNADKFIIFASHHPFFNKGVHSGSFGVKQHLFPFTDAPGMSSFYLPLPIVGSLYPLSRNAITTKQDLSNAEYTKMVYQTSRLMEEHPFVVFVAGQEKNLQLLQNDDKYHIISGAASERPSRVRHARDVDFAGQTTGFAVLEITKSKKVTALFYEVTPGGVKQVHTKQLADYSVFPPHAPDTAKMAMITRDSFTVAANTKYDHTFALNRWFAGNNYRKDWATPVKMKVFRIHEEKGGMEITGLGGGHQSKSLQLKDKTGNEWVLRQTNKSLHEVMPDAFKETIANDVAQDMISSSHPYGSLIVPDLLTATGVTHATPQVFFVPNDTALGEYRTLFANNVAQLEERQPTRNDIETENSLDVINKMIDEGDHEIDAKNYLKARMIDFIVSDFDRHYAQWRFGVKDTSNGTVYYPVPKDRDQAMFNSDGFLIWLARKRTLAYMQGFEPDIRKPELLGWAGRDMDKFFLGQLTEQEWKQAVEEVKAGITDEVIETAASKLPPEIFKLRGPQVISTLKSRRDQIVDKGMDYHDFMAEHVNVLGSNKDDIFTVAGENGGLWVKAYTKDKKGDTSVSWSKWIDPAKTKEVWMWGFNGNDHFEMSEDTRSKIKFRMVGGGGEDTFNMRGLSRNYLYDVNYEDNTILSRSKTTKMFQNDPSVNEYQFRYDMHDKLTFPLITLGANEDDGFLAGLGISRTTFGFRKKPFATQHRLTTLFALQRQAYQVRYAGEFNHAIKYFDVLVNAELVNPTLNYFFGLGNESKRDMSKPVEYYRARYDYLAADVMLRRRILNDSMGSISFGPAFFYYWNDGSRNVGRVLETPSVVGLDSAGVYAQKVYAGGKFAFNIDNVDNKLWPKRGITWNTELTVYEGMNNNAKPYSKLQSDFSLYATLSHPSNLVAVLRTGGGHIFSQNFEYFQALSLGAHNYLRGFRKNRFNGSSMAYGTGELRLRLLDFNAYVIKGDFGVIGFGETGRVWMRNESSNKWHHSYGGGVYLTPFNMVIVSAVLAISEEDKLFNAGVGTRINIVFQGNN
jgi:hypothetical protein